MEFVALYLTAPDTQTADRLATLLVEERLAACVNVLGSGRSTYRWEGRVERADEVFLIAKTTADKADAAAEAIVGAHPYDCPCVTVLPIVGGHGEFLDWVKTETE